MSLIGSARKFFPNWEVYILCFMKMTVSFLTSISEPHTRPHSFPRTPRSKYFDNSLFFAGCFPTAAYVHCAALSHTTLPGLFLWASTSNPIRTRVSDVSVGTLSMRAGMLSAVGAPYGADIYLIFNFHHGFVGTPYGHTLILTLIHLSRSHTLFRTQTYSNSLSYSDIHLMREHQAAHFFRAPIMAMTAMGGSRSPRQTPLCCGRPSEMTSSRGRMCLCPLMLTWQGISRSLFLEEVCFFFIFNTFLIFKLSMLMIPLLQSLLLTSPRRETHTYTHPTHQNFFKILLSFSFHTPMRTAFQYC